MISWLVQHVQAASTTYTGLHQKTLLQQSTIAETVAVSDSDKQTSSFFKCLKTQVAKRQEALQFVQTITGHLF